MNVGPSSRTMKMAIFHGPCCKLALSWPHIAFHVSSTQPTLNFDITTASMFKSQFITSSQTFRTSERASMAKGR